MSENLANLDAERAILGALMVYPGAWDEALGVVDSDAFYRGAHRDWWEAMLAMRLAGRPIDSVTVADELERRGLLDNIGAHTLARAQTDAPPGGFIARHAQIVADLAYRRSLVEHGEALMRAAADPRVDVGETVAGHMLQLSVLPTSEDLPIFANHELDQLPEPSWIIDGHLPEGLLALYGPSSSGKSFVALDWSLCLASGRAWFGNAVQQRRVLYVAGEGAAGIRVRRDAWLAEHRADVTGFHVLGQAVNLLDGRVQVQLTQAVRRLGIGFVVLDTLNRTMGGDENSTEHMSAYIAACTQLMQAGATVLIVHHTGVDTTRMRGNTALYAACDAVAVVEREPESDEIVVLNDYPRGKQKDAEPFTRWHLRMHEVEGLGREGSQKSVALRTASSGIQTYRAPIDSLSEPLTPLAAAMRLGVPHDVVVGLVAKGRLVEVEGGVVAARHAGLFAPVGAF